MSETNTKLQTELAQKVSDTKYYALLFEMLKKKPSNLNKRALPFKKNTPS